MTGRWDGGVGTLRWRRPRTSLAWVLLLAAAALGVGFLVPELAAWAWVAFVGVGLFLSLRGSGEVVVTWDARRLTLRVGDAPSTTLGWDEVEALRVGVWTLTVRTPGQVLGAPMPGTRAARDVVGALLERAQAGRGPELPWEGRGDHERHVWPGRELRVAPTHLVWVDGAAQTRVAWDDVGAVEGDDGQLTLSGPKLTLRLDDVPLDRVFGLGDALRERSRRYRASADERARVAAARQALERS